MPFTISHAAAAIPFRRTRLVLSALIIGCMAPDFEYFMHGRMIGRLSHNFRGAFEFCLPASLILLLLFHWLLKRPVAALLPAGVQRRIVFEPFSFWPLTRLLMICLSILVGVATHLFWDSFTHNGRWAVERLPWLQQTTHILGRDMANYKIAQNISTLLGLLLLTLWFLQWYRDQPEHDLPMYSLSSGSKFVIIVGMIAIASALGLARALAILGTKPISALFVGNVVVAFVSTVFVEILVFSLALQVRMSDRFD